MTNVINPIWFYLCDVFDIIKNFAAIDAWLIGIAWLLAYVLGWWLTSADASLGEDDRDYKEGLALKATAKKLMIPFVIAFSIDIFVPSEKTVYKMMVANLATYENIDIAADTIEDAFDHVIDKLVELGDKEK
jgi:hypothetical protein